MASEEVRIDGTCGTARQWTQLTYTASKVSDVPRQLSRVQAAVRYCKTGHWLAWRLTTAYCTCVTVQAALEEQSADHDPEFARCLRSGVADAVDRQVERLHALVRRLSGASLGPP